MRLRRLNESGLEAMRQFLASLTTAEPQAVPVHLLSEDRFSLDVATAPEVEPRPFGSRFEAAQYLYDRFDESDLRDVERDVGLWAWLSLFYLDQLAPADSGGVRKPGELARWIPDVNYAYRYYRHLLAGPYRIYRAHHDQPERAMALLCQPLNRPGDIVEQLAARQELVTNKAVIEVAGRLYIDPDTARPKRGAGGRGRGSPRRYAEILGQFDVTWDLMSVSTDQLLAMLPGEFNRFRDDS